MQHKILNNLKLPLVGLMAGLATAPAVAVKDPISIFFTTGQYFFDNKVRLDDEMPYTLGAGYDFSERWGAELSYTSIEPEDETTGLDTDNRHVQFDALYYLADRTSWQPYLVAGFGDREIEFDNKSDEDSAYANAGIGVKKLLSERVQFRTDARAYYDFEDEYTDYAVNIGLAYVFGDRKSKPKPVPAPVPMDSDGDGVYDDKDKCPNSPSTHQIDLTGCSIMALDTDTIELDIKFANDSSVIKPAYRSEVQQVADFMSQHPDTKVVIEGHTDGSGSAEYNKMLSQKRADAVKQLLITDYGIHKERVSAVGYGAEKPIASNHTKEGRQKNRRVVAELSFSEKRPVLK